MTVGLLLMSSSRNYKSNYKDNVSINEDDVNLKLNQTRPFRTKSCITITL